MKTIIFFLALLFSFMTIINTIANIMNTIAKWRHDKSGNNLIPETVWGIIACILWAYFYYL